MKKLWVVLVVVLMFAGSVSAQVRTTPYTDVIGCQHYFGTIPYANDTIWYPGQGTNNALPNVWGFDLTPYKYLGYEVDWFTTDTTHPDMICTLMVDLYTGYFGDKDSINLLIPGDSIYSGHIGNAAGAASAQKWAYIMTDTSYTPAPYFFQQYVWWAIRAVTTQGTDTTFTGVPDTDGDLWSAAGDSLLDWNSVGADGYFWDMLVEAEHDSFIYVTGKDSLLALAMDIMSCGTDPGVIDSLVFFVSYWESLTVIAPDTFRIGVVFGDSSQHHYDSLDIGVGGSGVLWATQLCLDSTVTAEQRDTVSFCFPLDPYSRVWTRTSLDSCIVILDPVHVDTTSAGDNGILCVAQLWTVTYHARSKLEPDIKYRLTVWGKE